MLIATEPEEPAQEWLLESGVDLHADVLKVPHHGAATSVPEFFDAVDAEVAVVVGGGERLRAPDRVHARRPRGIRRAGLAHRPARYDHGPPRRSHPVGRVRAMAVKTGPVTLLWGEDAYLVREAALDAPRRDEGHRGRCRRMAGRRAPGAGDALPVRRASGAPGQRRQVAPEGDPRRDRAVPRRSRSRRHPGPRLRRSPSAARCPWDSRSSWSRSGRSARSTSPARSWNRGW